MQAYRAILTLSLASAVALACACLAPCADAAPFIPSDDAQVLERLPSRSAAEFRDLKALQAAAAKAPGELAPALALANAYVRASRVEGDPRFLGYAQAALARWWKDPQAPTPVLLLRATILQSNHEFDAAVADLGLVLQREPGQRAGIADSRHGADGAGQVCAGARRLHAPRRRRAVDLRRDLHRGDRRDDRQRVVRVRFGAEGTARRCPASTPRRRNWGQTLLAEIAHRRGDAAAEAHFKAALAADATDLYALAAYSDWLLDQRRAADVVALLKDRARIDILLLRLALAQQALKSAEAATSIQTLRARFDASHARGDTVHLRENARFELVAQRRREERASLRDRQPEGAARGGGPAHTRRGRGRRQRCGRARHGAALARRHAHRIPRGRGIAATRPPTTGSARPGERAGARSRRRFNALDCRTAPDHA